MNQQLSDSFLEVQTREDTVIARFTQQVCLTGQLAENVSEQLMSVLSEKGRQQLLVDFGNIESLTSYMLGQLVKLSRAAKETGRRFALFNLRHHVRQILEISRLDLLLALYEDESAALRAS
jgi:anti-anti-sigma factor